MKRLILLVLAVVVAGLFLVNMRGDPHVAQSRQRLAVFWSLFPIACGVAVRRYPRPTLFCVSLFGVAFVVHSLAAFKAERYLYYAMPAFFCVWGMAAPTMLAWLRRTAGAFAREVLPRTPRLASRAATVPNE